MYTQQIAREKCETNATRLAKIDDAIKFVESKEKEKDGHTYVTTRAHLLLKTALKKERDFVQSKQNSLETDAASIPIMETYYHIIKDLNLNVSFYTSNY